MYIPNWPVVLCCILHMIVLSCNVLYLQRLDEAQKEKEEVEKLTESTKLVLPVGQLEESSQERIKISAMRQSKMDSLAKVSTLHKYCTYMRAIVT